MNDRELLELAARAAGYRIKRGCETGLVVWIDDVPVVWNPLEGDGDAFRLAIAVGICVALVDGCMACGRWYAKEQGLTMHAEPVAGLGAKEREAATRRAITRAAAEIGRAGGELPG